MDDLRELNLKPNRSFYLAESPGISTHSQPQCKSEIHVPVAYEMMVASCSYKNINFKNSDDEYYKRYEHDETPVKDSSFHTMKSLKGRVALTNSDLDKLEIQVFSNVSQQLQTDESSVSSLESNIKFFKTTVQEIFDNFYANMRDFELYKKRFHEILAKNKEDSLGDMEEFIKDMIQHIMSSEASNESNKSDTAVTESEINTQTWSAHGDASQDLISRDNTSEIKSADDILNIFLMNDGPCVQIKMNDRNHLSEINIKSPNLDAGKNQIASADNLKKLAAKKLLLENYIMNQEVNAPDREIPVKVSYAKKNIHLDEDFIQNDSGDSKSFMARLCNYLCKRFRKNSFG